MNRSNNLTPFLLAAAITGFGIHATAATLNVPVDQPTIQAAINAAAEGDTIIVAANTYTENLLVDKAITLSGPNSTLDGADPSRVPEALLDGNIRVEADNVTILGLEINGTNVTQSGFTLRGILVGNTGSRNNVIIENNVIKSWATGISLSGGASFPWNNNVAIQGNKFVSASIGSTENVGALTIINNTFESAGIGLGGGAVLAVPITGNTFYGGSSRYVSAAAGVIADFSDVLVHNTFDKAALTGAASGQWYDRAIFATIQGAINASASGATVEVAAGTYDENVIVNKPLTLSGANAGVGFGSRAAEAVIAPATGLPVSITSDHVTLSGFEIIAPNASNAIVLGNADNLTVEYNWIHDVGTAITNTNVHAIICTVGNAPSTISSVGISDNLIENIASSGLTGYSASAIGFLQSTSTGTLDGLSIERNTISNVTVNSGDWPTGKIAYGILLNVAGGTGFASSSGKIMNATIADNTISNLSGFIATGIGLEGNTEGALVQGNVVSSLSGRKSSDQSGGGLDLSAVKIEKNRFAGTVVITGNSFQVETFTHDGDPGLGYAISSYEDASLYGAPTANLNWLGAADIATILGDGLTTGKVFVKSGASVEFDTWFTDAALTTLASSLPIENITQNTFHGTIQAAIDAATAGDTIIVAAGTYEEMLSIDKALTLLGPNDGTAGYDAVRVAEAVIQYPAGITDGFNVLVSMNSDDVKISGFTLNDNLTAGLVYDGTWPLPLSASGIRNSHSNATVEYNKFFGFNYIAMHMTQDGASSQPDLAATTGNLTRYNLFEGGAVFSSIYYQAAGGTIAENELSNVAGGVQVQPYRTDASGVVSNNQISTYTSGMHYNYANGSQIGVSDWTFSGNSVVVPSVSPVWDQLIWNGLSGVFAGIRVETYIETAKTYVPTAHFEGNSIDGDGAETPEFFGVRGMFFRNVNGDASQNVNNITFVNNISSNVEVGVQFSELTTVEYDLDPLFGNGNTYPGGMVVFEPYQIGFAPVVNVTQAIGYGGIQDAIDAADPGDTLEVGPGTYSEVLLVDKALSLLGPNASVSAVTGTRNAEARLTERINISATDDVTISGFEFFEVPATSTWTIYIYGNSNNFAFENNRFIDVDKDAIRSGISSATGNITVTGNLIEGMNNTLSSGILLGGIYGVSTISNNRIDLKNTGYAGIQTPNASNLVISGNEILNTTNQGIQLAGTCSDVIISGNVISNTNTSEGADKGAIRLYGSAFTGPITITGNTLTNSFNGIAVKNGEDISGVVIQVQDNDLSGNSNHGAYNGATAGTLQATENYWGESGGPYLNPSLITGNVTFSPWYADEARTILVTAANFQDVTVPAGSSVTETDLYIGAGATYTVLGSLAVTGELTLTDGAVLEVINGSLTINGSTLSGSFTFFNSLGSINFNDDVAITGSAEGLILISDVHVADAATITVDGTLVIDGSVVDCQDPSGSYTLQVNAGATFTMARTVFVNGNLVVESADTAIYDNRFESSTIAVDAGAPAARVFHNLTDDLGWLTGTAVTTVDGWGNLTDPSLTENNLALGLDISGLPADRTQDVDGSVFIQPGDLVTSSLDVSGLQTEISAVEAMLGYNTGLLGTTGLVADSSWNAVLDSNFDSSNMIGLIDSALGYTLTIENPSAGSSADQTIATVDLTAGTTEGETLFFHRVKLATDVFGGETRLTTGGGSPAFLTPFTSNSSMITIDGTDPLIADPAAYATIEQFAADVNTVTTPAAVTIQGDVDITASAFDALAGIEDAKAVVTLVGPDTYTATQTGTSAGPNIGGDDYTTYSFTYTVDATTENGTYDVVFTVTDRSGNQTVETLGSILINKNQVELNIELEGLAAGPLTRDVVLVFTDAGGAVIETRTEAVEFTSGVGSVTLTDVDGTSFRLSAKAAWNLRKRLEIGIDLNGQALVEFTGVDELRGGDLNGDNVVNTLDYSILRFNWFTTNAVADITGDGAVNLTDFNILQGNFYQAGDPQ